MKFFCLFQRLKHVKYRCLACKNIIPQSNSNRPFLSALVRLVCGYFPKGRRKQILKTALWRCYERQKKWWVWRHNVKVGKWTYQAGPQDSLLVWTALVSPWMCAQQTLSGNFRRNRIRSDSLVSMAKSEHHKAGIKQDGLWSKGLTLRVHERMREFTTRWDPNKSNSFYSSYFS